MNDSEALIGRATVAYILRRLKDAASFADLALAINASSQSAATIKFLAHWDANQGGVAAQFIIDFIARHGGSVPTLHCAIAGMVELGYPDGHLKKWAGLWID